MKHVRQVKGTRHYGQCCVAMIKGISLSDAVLDVGHEHGTNNGQVIKALGQFVWPNYSKFVPLKSYRWNARLCSDHQMLLLESNDKKHKRFVVFNADEQQVYDPGWPEPMEVDRYLKLLVMNNWRVKSYLPVKGLEDVGESKE